MQRADYVPDAGDTLGIGVVGCGKISSVYLTNLNRYPGVRVAGVSDLDLGRAREAAAAYDVPRAYTLDDLLDDENVDIVLDLTVPTAHADVNMRAVEAGKHVYSEKPLTVHLEDARRLLEVAQSRDVRVGGAPDTFLGGAHQLARRLIDEGAIGQVVGASAFMGGRGPEVFHPNPAFFYEPGAGPMFDMGPYYITALVHSLGPVSHVTGAARVTRQERTILSEPLRGQTITVQTPTHVVGLLELSAGPIATLTTSFDIARHTLPEIEVFGTEGTLVFTDPNYFEGPVRLYSLNTGAWETIEGPYPPKTNWRGAGVADMANAIREDRPHRASGDLAYHVLDVMHAVFGSAESGQRVTVESTCERPEPLHGGIEEITERREAKEQV